MEQLRAFAITEIKDYIADVELTADEFTEEYHQDTLIQQVFNSDLKFQDLDDVDNFLGGSIHTLSECMDVYKEYMTENGFPLDADVIKIMNMCLYITGQKISYIDITQYIQDHWDAEADGDTDSDTDSDEEILLEPSQ